MLLGAGGFPGSRETPWKSEQEALVLVLTAGAVLSPVRFQVLSALIFLSCMFSSWSKCFFRETAFELFIDSVFSHEKIYRVVIWM